MASGRRAVVTDEEDNKVVDKLIDNNLNNTLELLAPYKEQIKAVAIESTFNWYWLVDGLMDHDKNKYLRKCHKVGPFYRLITDTSLGSFIR